MRTQIHASRINQAEIFFSIVRRKAPQTLRNVCVRPFGHPPA